MATFWALIWLKFPFGPSVNEVFENIVAGWFPVVNEWEFSMLPRFFDILWKPAQAWPLRSGKPFRRASR